MNKFTVHTQSNSCNVSSDFAAFHLMSYKGAGVRVRQLAKQLGKTITEIFEPKFVKAMKAAADTTAAGIITNPVSQPDLEGTIDSATKTVEGPQSAQRPIRLEMPRQHNADVSKSAFSTDMDSLQTTTARLDPLESLEPLPVDLSLYLAALGVVSNTHHCLIQSHICIGIGIK
jgi:hypothetical protein